MLDSPVAAMAARRKDRADAVAPIRHRRPHQPHQRPRHADLALPLVRKAGARGLLLTLDLRPALRVGAPGDATLRYSHAAVMDLYEVLREIIDDIEHLPGLFLLGLADQSLVAGDHRRTLDTYKALEMRIWPDVRPGDRQNPLAPLVTVSG